MYRDFGGEKKAFHIVKPKTEAGIRKIPITSEVKKQLLQQKLIQRYSKYDTSDYTIDGYSNFVFTSVKGGPLYMDNVNNTLYKIVKHYNKDEQEKAEKEKRTPEFLPHISCHILRHTACTRMLEDGMDIKVVQRIMGHSSIRVTMDIYNHISDERAKKEVLQREEKRRSAAGSQ